MDSTNHNQYITKSSGIQVDLPLFIPVYRPDYSFRLFGDGYAAYGLSAVMVNAFLLYRDRALRKKFEQGYTLREHIGGFPGMLCTDSGAFQQLKGRKVDLDPLDIVRFQNLIKTDIAAPLDLITPPDTGYDETLQRMVVSQHRIAQAAKHSDYADLAGIQQGGGFLSLRMEHIRQLAKIGFRYYGIGSMVPFFNKNHDLHFTCSVIRDAREVIGPAAAMHVYGAGDPLDMAFMFHAGANIFDSSSYAHYAKGGFYMTPFGAVVRAKDCDTLEYVCACPVCAAHGPDSVFEEKDGCELMQQHNLFVLLDIVRVLGKKAEEGCLEAHVAEVYDKHLQHADLFSNSRLGPSWERYLSSETDEQAKQKAAPAIIKGKELSGMHMSDTEELLLRSLAEEITADYKADTEKIYEFLSQELLAPKNHALRKALSGVDSPQSAQRLGGYKQFRKQARGAVYKDLRRYKTSDYDVESGVAAFVASDAEACGLALERLLGLHVSTRERFPYRDEYIEKISGIAAAGDTIIDIGCGFHPLMLPPEFYRSLKCYIAVDRDVQAVEAARIFAEKFGIDNLRAFTWDISQGTAALEQLTGIKEYDLALLMKVIPVVCRAEQAQGRQDASMVSVLGRFPAKRILTTVSRESMTKHKSIEKRELATLHRFMETYGLVKTEDIEIGNEAGYLLEKGQ